MRRKVTYSYPNLATGKILPKGTSKRFSTAKNNAGLASRDNDPFTTCSFFLQRKSMSQAKVADVDPTTQSERTPRTLKPRRETLNSE